MNEELLRAIAVKLSDKKFREGNTEFIEEIREIDGELHPHFSHDYPGHILIHQHPGEEEWAKDYRKGRWTSPTMQSSFRIYTSLQKIQQANDFKISLENDPAKTGIIEENSFANYLYEGLPKFKSLETWLFQLFLLEYLKGPNSVVLVLPDLEEWKKDPTIELDFANPYPQIVCSDEIVYKTESNILIQIENWKDKDGVEWNQFMLVTETGLVHYKQTQQYQEDTNVFQITVSDFGIFEKFPVIDVGSIIEEIEEGQKVYNSVIQGCIGPWKEVLYRHSDLIVNWAMHGNPQKWVVVASKCKTCHGSGSTLNSKNEKVNCKSCNGTGESMGSPFKTIEINMTRPNATNPNVPQPPMPPVGYAQLDIKALEKQKEDIIDKTREGFQAIGLELLSNLPAAQSGIAKQYDRKEINTFFYQVAVHLSDIYLQVADIIYIERYSAIGIYSSLTEDHKLASEPQISIPTDFDVITAPVIAEQLAMAIDKDFNPVIVYGYEVALAEKQYGENSEAAKLLKMYNQLDPLPFYTSQEKIELKDSGGCSKEDFILSVNLKAFLQVAMQQNKDFDELETPAKMAILKQLAAAKTQEINAQIVPMI